MTRWSPDLADKAAVARALLARVAAEHAPALFTTSFGAEDMVVLDLIAGDGAGSDADAAPALRTIGLATLDTGRLPDETYQVWQRATERYRRKVDAYFPQAPAVEQYVRIHGINAFYDSVVQRQDCCHIRKVEPLARALAGRGAWITGLRRAQAASRERARRRRVRRGPRARQGQPARRLVGARRLGLRRGPRRAGQRAACEGLSEHRLRAVHARGRAGRGRPRRALVVGAGRRQGMRPARRVRARTRGKREATMKTTIDEWNTVAHAAADHATEGDPTHLDRLESEAIHVMREVAAECRHPVLLFSGGKDSIVMLRLAEKAFRPGRFPFPLLHVDTGHNFPEVIAFRDARAAELGERLIVRSRRGFDRERPRAAEDARRARAIRTRA